MKSIIWKREHENLVEEYQREVELDKNDKKKPKLMDDATKRKQTSLSTFVKIDADKSVSALERLIVDFVLHGMHPLSVVEEPAFIAMIKG